jgi:hypothetical protein
MESYEIPRTPQETCGENKVLLIKSTFGFGQNKINEYCKYVTCTSARFLYRFALDQLPTGSLASAGEV